MPTLGKEFHVNGIAYRLRLNGPHPLITGNGTHMVPIATYAEVLSDGSGVIPGVPAGMNVLEMKHGFSASVLGGW